jgi:two-component system response regulator FixJ
MLAKVDMEPVVYIVDDDQQCCRAAAELVRTFGHEVKSFDSSRQFIDELDHISPEQPGCVVTDLRMPGIDGLELIEQIAARDLPLHAIVVTGFADTATTVRALRNGAVAVLDKPFRDDELWSFVQEAITKSQQTVRRHRRRRDLQERFRSLSPQDRQVLQLIMEGSKNRTMAKRLDVSLRTVENRRRRVFDVMRADSVAELARMVVEYEHDVPATTSEAWFELPFERTNAAAS